MSEIYETRFNEDTRVKIPATLHFLRLGYQYQSLKDADIDFKTKVFINRFKPAIEKINHRAFTNEEILSLLDDINTVISYNDLGKAFFQWLLDPVDRVKLIDFDDISLNDFAVVDELSFTIKEDTRDGSFRPDINILINGIPLCFMEVKKPNNDGGIQQEFHRMIDDRLAKDEYKKFFNLLQVVSFSNNMEYEDTDDAEDVKAGSFYTTPNRAKTTFSFFREYRSSYYEKYPYALIDDETVRYIIKDLGYNPSEADTEEFSDNMKTTTPCNSFITSLFDKERILYFIHYGIVYVDGQVPQKHIMRYPQFFATRMIVERLEAGGKGGIIWHTQGSGKTGLSAFSNRILNDYYAKKNINARFFFVVDRLELLNQAAKEFKKRGLSVIECSNRAEFARELNKPLSTNKNSKSIGEVCVVNIQKFEEAIPEARNDYNAKVQRVFFIDEAHRSYKYKGEFFKNLMLCDDNAVYIALTGTPLLTKKERSELKFGSYIHTYFYDKSIQDGYTLRIKKEHIDTVAKSEIKKNLDIEDDKLEDKDVYESDAYVSALGEFIQKDFLNFRLVNSDTTIGGMVVCRTNKQAKKMQKWFEDNSSITTGLVISDESDPIQQRVNKHNQEDFRDTNVPDMLVVNFMLTTGYDVQRLKKMYLLRGPHAQTLLQTISRVNRPYKSPNGKVYKYGYIVDFVDIEREYNETIEDYIKELEEELKENSDEDASLNGLVIDKEDINNKCKKYWEELNDIVDTDNRERFSKQLTMLNKQALYKVRRYLRSIKECHTEFLLSRAFDYAEQIDIDKIKALLKSTQERIDFVNLSTNTVDMMDVISNTEVVNIVYEFIKTKITILDLGKLSADNEDVKRFTDTVVNVQKEIKNNKNKKDIRIVKLDQLLQEIFEKLSISDLSDLNSLTDELNEALQEARRINAENERLSMIYGGHYAFVKTYQDAILNYGLDGRDLEQVLIVFYQNLKEVIETQSIIIQGRKNFIANVKHDCTKELLKAKLYGRIKSCYDDILSELYTNIQIFK